jgi:hypothetical protein
MNNKDVSEIVRIQGIEAKPGTKSFGYLKVHDSSTLKVDMPLGIVNGAEPGPTLAITGGLYGTLFPGIEAVIRIYNRIDPNKLKGVLLSVPVIDMPAFQARVGWNNPIDNKSLYTAFPGKPDGSISQIIAYTLFHEVIKRSQYHIDLRGGDIDELLISFSIYCRIGDKGLDAKTEAMAKVYGTEVVLKTSMQDWGEGAFLVEACKHGVAAITGEAGLGMGRLDEEDVQTHITGVNNVMQYLGMLEGTPKSREIEQLIEISPMYMIYAKQGGLFYPKIEKLGTIVAEGELLGEIKNLSGEVVENFRAPVDGILHVIFTHRAARVGDLLMAMRRISKE